MFLYLITIILIFISSLLIPNNKESKFLYLLSIGFVFVSVTIVFILNPPSSDMFRYLRVLNNMKYVKFLEAFDITRFEGLFTIYLWLVARISTNQVFFMVLNLLIILSLMLLALRKIISLNALMLIAFGYMSLFTFYNLTTNILRQGFASAFVIFSIVCLIKNKYFKSLILLIIATFFHTSAVIVLPLLIVKKFNYQLKSILIIYVFSAFMMFSGLNSIVLNIFQLVDSTIIGSSIVSYSQESIIERYGPTNRFDFFIFNTFWLVLGLLAYKYLINKDAIYKLIISFYAILTSIFMILGFIAYSDRIAAYSWILIPLVLVYPVDNISKRYKKLYLIGLIGIFVFLFMFFGIYSRYLFII